MCSIVVFIYSDWYSPGPELLSIITFKWWLKLAGNSWWNDQWMLPFALKHHQIENNSILSHCSFFNIVGFFYPVPLSICLRSGDLKLIDLIWHLLSSVALLLVNIQLDWCDVCKQLVPNLLSLPNSKCNLRFVCCCTSKISTRDPTSLFFVSSTTQFHSYWSCMEQM